MKKKLLVAFLMLSSTLLMARGGGGGGGGRSSTAAFPGMHAAGHAPNWKSKKYTPKPIKVKKQKAY